MSRWSLAVVAALAFAACGDEDRDGSVSVEGGTTGTTTTGTQTTTTPSGAPVQTIRVTETEFKLDPANPQVKKAGVVEFRIRNDGQVVHALEVEGPEGEVETENIDPGKSASLKADLSKPGSYEWYCPVDDHKDRGMRGKIEVAGGDSGGGTATTEDERKPEDESGGGGGGSGY